METLEHTETEMIAALLVGHSITDVFDGKFVLDNGTELRIGPNQGCDCGDGEYRIDFMKKVNNIITNVTFGKHEDGETVYTISVYTEGTQNENGDVIMSVSGSDGNGYYGTGYIVNVVFPK